MKRETYINIIQKKNGKYFKNKEYTLEEFCDKIIPFKHKQKSLPKIFLFDRMFKTNTYKRYRDSIINNKTVKLLLIIRNGVENKIEKIIRGK